MKSPPWDDIDTSTDAGLLNELSSAVRAGSLVGILKGQGLTRNTIEELLQPESAIRLKAILTDHLFPERDPDVNEGPCKRGTDDPEHGPADGSYRGGTVLVYQKKETFRP